MKEYLEGTLSRLDKRYWGTDNLELRRFLIKQIEAYTILLKRL